MKYVIILNKNNNKKIKIKTRKIKKESIKQNYKKVNKKLKKM